MRSSTRLTIIFMSIACAPLKVPSLVELSTIDIHVFVPSYRPQLRSDDGKRVPCRESAVGTMEGNAERHVRRIPFPQTHDLPNGHRRQLNSIGDVATA